MTKYQHMIYWFLILGLHLSCVGSNQSAKERKDNSKNALTNISLYHNKDTLTYTSGIRCILKDSKGNYWFGSDQEGACRFDEKVFTYFTTEDGLSGNQVKAIKEDEFGTIWFETNNGVCSFKDGKITEANQDDILGKVKSKWAIADSDIWLNSGSSTDIIRIYKQDVYRLQFPIKDAELSPTKFGATGFSKGKNGNIWIAYYSGVLGYDGQKFTHFNDSILKYDGHLQYMHVRSILEDSKGRLWIGNNGIGVLLKEGNSITHFSQKFNLVKPTIFPYPSPAGTLMHVFAIKEDKQGNIWFGDRDTGAWRFDGKEMKNFTVDPTLKSQHIWDIYEDNNGELLFAMGDKGVYRFVEPGFYRIF